MAFCNRQKVHRRRRSEPVALKALKLNWLALRQGYLWRSCFSCVPTECLKSQRVSRRHQLSGQTTDCNQVGECLSFVLQSIIGPPGERLVRNLGCPTCVLTVNILRPPGGPPFTRLISLPRRSRASCCCRRLWRARGGGVLVCPKWMSIVAAVRIGSIKPQVPHASSAN
jgi:hypothetical protein